MSKKRHVLPLLVGISANALAGCDEPPKVEAEEPEEDRPAPTNTEASRVSPPTAKPPPPPPKLPPTTIIRRKDPIPKRLGGAPRRIDLPRKKHAPRAMRPGAVQAPQAPARAPAPAGPPEVAVAIVHDHPADEACAPLTDAEVRTALDDVRSAQ